MPSPVNMGDAILILKNNETINTIPAYFTQIQKICFLDFQLTSDIIELRHTGTDGVAISINLLDSGKSTQLKFGKNKDLDLIRIDQKDVTSLEGGHCGSDKESTESLQIQNGQIIQSECVKLKQNSFCSDKADGYYPHDKSCRLYYDCTGGETWEYPCPHINGEDHQWSREKGYCVAPENSDCNLNPSSEFFCADKLDGKYAHNTSCRLYYECSQGKTREQDCYPASYLWNGEAGACMKPEEAHCTIETIINTTIEPTTTTLHGEFSYSLRIKR